MRNRKELNETTKTLLLSGFGTVIEIKRRKGSRRTAANYRAAARKVSTYLGDGAGTFRLREVTSDWVGGFVEWLRSRHAGKPQTVDFYLRTVRAMCNHLLELRRLRWRGGENPFDGIRIKGIRHAKRALTEQEVRRLLHPSFRERLPVHLHRALDVLSFILYERGMVFQDLYNLTWSMVSPDGHIFYLRSKTRCPIDVEVTPEAARIMERYHRGDSPWVFPFLHEGYNTRRRALSEESALRRINDQAKRIGAEAGIPIPLTTYVMRHTWATLMLEAGKSVELIGQCLGHTSIETTQIYLSNISVSRVDREVNDMVDRMLRESTPSRKGVPVPVRNHFADGRPAPIPKGASQARKGAPAEEIKKKITGIIRRIPFLGKKEKNRTAIGL